MTDKATYRLEREQWVPAPLDQVFPFFADAANLQELTPDWLKFEILTPQPVMGVGTLIDYRLRWHGVPLRWRTEIVSWDPPHGFEDLQIQGPYRLWHHTHSFQSENGGTRLLDRVDYALTFGLLGRVVHRLTVRHNVEQIFDFRQQKIRERFGA